MGFQVIHVLGARAISHHTKGLAIKLRRSRAMRCEWVVVKDRVYQCRRCGKIIASVPGIEPRWDAMPECPGQRKDDIKARLEELASQGPEYAKRIDVCRECNGLRSCPKCRGCDGLGLWAARIKYGRCEKFATADGQSMDLKNFFERVYVINLERRADRLKQFFDGLPKDWPFRVPERWPAVDGKKCPPPPWWKAGRGAWGCYKTHVGVLERCLNEGVQSVLILEDDAVFNEHFATQAKRFLEALPTRQGMIYFGGQHLFQERHPPQKINDHVFLAYNINRTHAYGIFGHEAIETVYVHLHRHDWKEKHHIDHHYGRIHESGKIPVFCPAQWLVGQRAGKSNISGRENANNQFWRGAELVWRHHAPQLNPVAAVVGPFRSGTSCVAGILHALGISMGAQLPSPEQTKRFNPKGTFEAVWLAKMCRRFFNEPEMIEQVPRPQRIAELRRWAEDRTRQVGQDRLIGAKHPTLCLMVEDMIEAWPDVRFIAVNRPVEESIKSALAGGWLPTAERAIPMMIEARNQALERVCSPVLWLEYHDLLKNSANAIERLIAFCGIDPTSQQIEAAVAFVDHDLRHHVTETGVA
ncbi:MAG: hypothetical protein Kow0040_14690 [Thermogutta sp.]